MPVALSPSLGLRWRLVGLASCAVFVDSYTPWALRQWPCRLRWRLFALASRDHFGIILRSFWHFAYVEIIWGHVGIILGFSRVRVLLESGVGDPHAYSYTL